MSTEVEGTLLGRTFGDRVLRLAKRTRERLAGSSIAQQLEELAEPLFTEPIDKQALWDYCAFLFKERRFAFSKAGFWLYLKIAPDDVRGWNGLGFSCHRRRQSKVASICFNHAIILSPKDSRAYVNLATLRAEGNRHEEAIELFATAASLDGSRAELWFNWANSLKLFQSRFHEACEKYRKAIELDPDLAIAHHNLALLLWKRGRFLEARRHWAESRAAYDRITRKRGGSLRPSDECFYGFILHFAYSELQQALRAYNAADSAPGLAMARRVTLLSNKISLLLELEEETGRMADHYHLALETFERLQRLCADEQADLGDRACTILAALHLEFGNWKEAEKAVRKGLALDPSDPEAHRILGLALIEDGRNDTGLFHLRQATTWDPTDVHTRCTLAEALLKCGDTDGAQGQFHTILRAAPGLLRALVGLGKSNITKGDSTSDSSYFRKAHSYLTEAIELQGTDRASRRMSSRRLAETLYSRAYSQARLFEIEGFNGQRPWLTEATRDCFRCLSNNPSHREAKRLATTLQRRLRRPRRTSLLGVGHVALSFFAFLVTLQTQISYYFGRLGDELSSAAYLGMTAIEFAILFAAVCLPDILKLKIGMVELEKAAPEAPQDEGPLLLSAPTGARG